ncbi:putative chromatin remodeling & transcription regulator BTB-POZ family [Helianthus debilis subsp. tardiflorus]
MQLFSNGTRESKQCHATLQINASEEAGLMELLKFMYSNNLTVTTAPAVLDVLMIADKFHVASCMRHCARLLRDMMIMTPEFLLVYLHFPPIILMIEALQPLTVFAKQFYAILGLPLAGVEEIIASDYLRVRTSEYALYSFVLKWAQTQYPKIEDQHEIINTRLAKFIGYPYMTYRELDEILVHNKELDRSFALLVGLEAVCFKENILHPTEINGDKSRRFVKRGVYQEFNDDNSEGWPVKTLVQDGFRWAWKRRQVFLCFTVSFLCFTKVGRLTAEEFVRKFKGKYAYMSSKSTVVR